jgi:hypothetical protein
MTDFTMPDEKELAKMSTDEIENKRIEAQKAANAMCEYATALATERRGLDRRILDIADKQGAARIKIREYRQCADELKSWYWRRKDGY